MWSISLRLAWDPARSTDVRIWNETGEKFFPQDKLFGPDGASDEIEAFIASPEA